MVPISKLATLPPKTRLRKFVLILQSAELELERGELAHLEYWHSVAGLLAREPKLDGWVLKQAASLLAALGTAGAIPGQGAADAAILRRAANRARHALLAFLGAEPAEWDLLAPGGGWLNGEARTVFPVEVYLEEIRSPFNVGAIFRAAEAFGVQRIFLSPSTPSPHHPRAEKSARGAVSVLPWQYADLSSLKEREGVFALELGGTPLQEFPFPERGVMLIGSEELGLSPEGLALAQAKAGRVSIPMAGAKRSLNVAVAFGIVMRAWFARLQAGLLAGKAHGSPG